MDDHQLSPSQNKHYVQLAYGIFSHIVHIFHISFDELKILIATIIGGKALKWKEPTNAKYKSIVDYITHDILCLSHLEGIYDSMVFKDKYNVMIVY